MIAYDLKCADGHIFEGWFENTKAFEQQLAKGMIACPICEDTRIERKLSTFGIVKAAKISAAGPEEAPATQRDEDVKIARLSRQLYDFVQQNFDDVGCDFAKEALKIHYGVSEPRNIRGVSSQEEEKLLEAEGITVFRVPIPPDKNETDA